MKVPHTLCPHTFSVYCQSSSEPPRDVISSANVTWDIKSPPSLERLVISALATNIEAWCPWLLQALGPDHISVVLEELSLELPLNFCIKNVPDGFYWQRRALAMWPGPEQGVCDVSRHGGSWRRLVLERHVQSLIESATPRLELQYSLRMQLKEVAPHVRALDLGELQSANLALKSGEQQIGHLPLALVLVHFPALQDLRIHIGPRECGLKFAWSKFTMSPADATSLNQGLAACPNLTSLRICSSHVTDQTVEMMLIPQPPVIETIQTTEGEGADGEVEEPEVPAPAVPVDLPPILLSLTHLDLSHNELQDKAAQILANFIISHKDLTNLRLINNKIGPEGASLLSANLELSGVRELDLSLNLVTDVGGTSLAEHCARLRSLRLAGCGLGLKTAQVFSACLVQSELHTLDLSNNQLSQQAGHVFYQALARDSNKVKIRDMDLRMTGIVEDDRQLIMETIRSFRQIS